MLRRFLSVCALAALPLSFAPTPGWSAGGEAVVPDTDFVFEGVLGRYDPAQLRRGLQVYTEVCSACHGMQYVPLRTLSNADGPALSDQEVRDYAAGLDPVILEDGTERPRDPNDSFPARVGEGMGPDLSLIAKARAGFHGPYGTGINQLTKGMGGPEYIVALLNGYTGEEKEEAGSHFYQNSAYAGEWIAMYPPLADDQVAYADGSPSDVRAMSQDVAAYLMWAAEPNLGARKDSGLVAVGMLLLLSVLLYLTNKRLWAKVKRPPSP
jgi:ubiquinol-cytochrome c reductase cytochrome c1 subunit